MAIFKFHIKPKVEIEDKLLQLAGNRLKRYFDRICKRGKDFSNSSFTISPNAGSVADQDLLVYIVDTSIIREIDPNAPLKNEAGGATALLAGGNVLSEIYWRVVTSRVRGSEDASVTMRQATAIANLSFHEFAHNKLIKDANTDVHVDCGGGILAANQSIGAIAGGDINEENEKALADVLVNKNTQYTTALS